MEITLCTSEIVKLPNEEDAAFEQQYAIWLKSKSVYGEYKYQKGSTEHVVRFDAIVKREITRSSAPAPSPEEQEKIARAASPATYISGSPRATGRR